MNSALIALLLSSMPAPTSLWELTREAPLVVFARVESVKKPESHFERVRLRVKEVWKGAPVKTVDVHNLTMTVCPAPDDFPVGREVVVFLEPSKLKASSPLWRSRSMRVVDTPRHLAALKAAVINADDQKADWAVAAFKSEFTRRDALLELEGVELSSSMFEELEQAFIDTPMTDELMLPTMKLFRSHDSERLSSAFAATIDQLAAKETQPKWFFEVVDLQYERVREKRTRDLQP